MSAPQQASVVPFDAILGASFKCAANTELHVTHHSFRIEKSCIEACNRDKYESSKKSDRLSSLTKAPSNDAKTRPG